MFVYKFLPITGPTATSHLESGGFARSRPGVEHPDIMFHFLPSQVIDHGRKAPWMEAFQVFLIKRIYLYHPWDKIRKTPDMYIPYLICFRFMLVLCVLKVEVGLN